MEKTAAAAGGRGRRTSVDDSHEQTSHEPTASTPIYLDYNATTPIHAHVVDAMLPYLTTHWGNASSAHFYGEEPRKALRKARRQVASLIGCENAEDNLYFTSGGTESNNMAIQGTLYHCMQTKSERLHIVTSTIEHPAVVVPCEFLESTFNVEVTRVECDRNGVISAEAVAGAVVAGRTALVTVMHANNESGALQPIEEIVRAVRAKDADVLIHTDASQSIGKVLVDVCALGVDMLTVCGHKLYAPKGTGAIYMNERARARTLPFMRGAGQERGVRPGTEAVAQNVALGAACALLGATSDAVRAKSSELKRLRDLLFDTLCRLCVLDEGDTRGAGWNARDARYGVLPNTLSFVFPANVKAQCVLDACPGVVASVGSACHSKIVSAGSTDQADHRTETERIVTSPVLRAMCVDCDTAESTLRLSVGAFTTEEEVRSAAEQLSVAWKRLYDLSKEMK